MPMRLVLDTDVIVASLRSSKGASRRLLEMALEGEIQILLSVALLLEYESVLSRPEHLKETGLSLEQSGDVLGALALVAAPVRSSFLWRPQLKDPADEMVLEAAVNGGADGLVTFNLRHLRPAAARFGIACGRPGEALAAIREWREKR